MNNSMNNMNTQYIMSNYDTINIEQKKRLRKVFNEKIFLLNIEEESNRILFKVS